MGTGNNIGDEGAKALAPALSTLTQLTELDLRRVLLHGGWLRGALAELFLVHVTTNRA